MNETVISLGLAIFGLILLTVCLAVRSRQRGESLLTEEPPPPLPDEPDPEDLKLTAKLVGHSLAHETSPHAPAAELRSAAIDEALLSSEAVVEWQERGDTFQPERIRVEELLRQPPFTPRELPEGAGAVLFRSAPWHTIFHHLRSSVEVEMGGLLLGRVFHDQEAGHYLVQVEEAIPARNALQTAESITYTPESWRLMTQQLRDMPNHWTVVGSYHSHPAMGVFLSETDLATQRDIYSQSWQIALVVDPVSGESGVFMGPEGNTALLWKEETAPQKV